MITIDKNIPYKKFAYNLRKNKSTKYPWNKMDVGDSFFVQDSTFSNMHTLAKNQSKNGKIFKASKRDSGIRVWRVQ